MYVNLLSVHSFVRLLWYTKIPCFDLFNLTGDHAHVLKHCEWAGQSVPCGELFQAIPTDVGICCSFNFNSSMKETVYAKLIRDLKMEELKDSNFSSPDGRNILKGRVGFEMGLKVAMDSHSNLASPATISSDGNAFQVKVSTKFRGLHYSEKLTFPLPRDLLT